MVSYGDIRFATVNKTSTIKGLKFPVSTSNTGGMFSRNFNEQCIRDGLIQLLSTQRGERPMRLDFGTDLRRSVFEPLDAKTIDSLRKSILSAISKYEPRVVVRSFNITPNIAESKLNISLVFSIKDNVFFSDQIYLTVDSKGVQVNG